MNNVREAEAIVFENITPRNGADVLDVRTDRADLEHLLAKIKRFSSLWKPGLLFRGF